mgnify:CR=1 FL=1
MNFKSGGAVDGIADFSHGADGLDEHRSLTARQESASASAARSILECRQPLHRKRARTDTALARVNSAGSARLSSSRDSANATGHQRTRGCAP